MRIKARLTDRGQANFGECDSHDVREQRTQPVRLGDTPTPLLPYDAIVAHKRGAWA